MAWFTIIGYYLLDLHSSWFAWFVRFAQQPDLPHFEPIGQIEWIIQINVHLIRSILANASWYLFILFTLSAEQIILPICPIHSATRFASLWVNRNDSPYSFDLLRIIWRFANCHTLTTMGELEKFAEWIGRIEANRANRITNLQSESRIDLVIRTIRRSEYYEYYEYLRIGWIKMPDLPIVIPQNMPIVTHWRWANRKNLQSESDE